MIYDIENIDKYLVDAPSLWLAHDAEVSSEEDRESPLDMNVEGIRGMENLIIFTARTNADELIGYIWFVLMHNPLRKTQLCAYQSLYYVVPEHRKTAAGVGAKLLIKAINYIRSLGIERIRLHHKLHGDYTAVKDMFERIGATPDELEYTLSLR